MFDNKSVLAVVLARGGSKRLPNKNKKLLGDKPLITWTIEASLASKHLDAICVSTDDEDILNIVSKFQKVKAIRRKAHLANDESRSADATIDVLDRYKEKFNYIMLLQPTSPLRTSEDIDKSIELIIQQNNSSMVSISKMQGDDKFCFIKHGENYLMEKNLSYTPSTSVERLFPNGAIYIIKTKKLISKKEFYTQDTQGFLMPISRSVDIDNLKEFQMAERYLKNT